VWFWISTACLAAASVGCLCLLLAIVLVGRFARRDRPRLGGSPSVTILKPLHGDQPGLAENLASFCTQDYAGPVQVIFGVQDPRDAAIGAASGVIERWPEKDLELLVDGRRHGSNGKVSNLINTAERIRHDVVVLADSDMRVPPDYLTRVVAELQRPGVGGVTCLYHGLPSGGLWSGLSALAIDTHFLPNVVVGLGLGLARPCFGSTIALGRATLDEIGGFAAFADVLADDYAIGAALRARGHAVAIPPMTVAHVCDERSPGELVRHEIRWARTIRSVDPAGYAGLGLTHPLAFGLLGCLFGGGAGALVIVIAALACRLVLCLRVERAFGLMPHPYWLLPVRDLFSFAIFVMSFFGAVVTWKGHDYRVLTNGNLVPDRRPPSP
jgi:ceramide glucosyltransferase